MHRLVGAAEAALERGQAVDQLAVVVVLRPLLQERDGRRRVVRLLDVVLHDIDHLVVVPVGQRGRGAQAILTSSVLPSSCRTSRAGD